MIRSIQHKGTKRLWNFISSGLEVDADLDILRKHILLNLIIILGSFFLTILAANSVFQHDYLLGTVDLILLLFLMWLMHKLRNGKDQRFVVLFGSTVTGCFYLFLVAYGGIEKTAYLWVFTYPVITLYLLGKYLGTVLTALLLAGSCSVFALSRSYRFLQFYEFSLIIRFVSVYLTIYIISLVNEVVRERIQERLKLSKCELERTVKTVQTSKRDLAASNEQLILEIEERKLIEKALRNSEGFLDDIIESIQDGISVLNADLTIRHTNSVINQWYHQKAPLIGKKCYACYHGRQAPCDSCPTIRCMHSGKTESDIMPGLPGSAVEWIEVFSFPIRDKDTEKICGAVEFVRDMTVPKRLERELAHAQKMEAVGTLAAGVAHDLNNILSGIVSYPELILMDLPPDSALKGPIQTVHKSGQKAAAIVQDLLTLARRGVSVKEVVSLNEIVSSFLTSPECRKIKEFHANVEFRIALEPQVLNVVGSPLHLSKSIMNLVSNAAEAMQDGGQLVLSTENRYLDRRLDGYEKIPEGDYVVLSVADAGSGIAASDLHKIFEPFYTKKKMGRSGTGLGMAVVWGTVKDLKGYIDVHSTPGRGTRFDLYFPATRRQRPQAQASVPMEAYRGSESVLVVDDVKEQRRIAAAMLSKLGYSVFAVASGEESVAYLQSNSADLVVLDMIMEPGMDGLETYRQIIALNPHQKAIIASGYSESARVKTAQQLGAGTYLKKPYTLEEIGLSIRGELDR